MKIFRRVCIGLVLLGLLLLHGERHSTFATAPFPGAGLAIKMDADVVTEGDYYLEVSMPKVGQTLDPGPAKLPCALVVNLAGQSKDVASLSLSSEVGYTRIQYYESNAVWHLRPGRYTAEVSSRQDCAAAMSRGAAISLAQVTTHLTERYLLAVLRAWSGVLFLSLGLLGVIVCEFRKA